MRRSAMMVLSLLVIVMLCVPAGAAIETVSSGDPGPINMGWNLISLPAIPTSPDPQLVFPGCPNALAGGLYRYDAATQSILLYDQYTPDAFGNMLLTDGYWLQLTGSDTNVISFEGITDNDDTDMWISLPKTGWSIIGCPFSYPVNWNTVEITDGTATVPLSYARDNSWLRTFTFWYDSSSQSLMSMGLDDDWGDSVMLEPWHGYWVNSLRDNLALIVPAAST